jgi:hypothetical protein
MITTVADFLQALIEREKAVLARQPRLNHAPMLGDMYEGLARNVLDRAIFDGLNLQVCEGKIRDAEGKLSGQVDCMIVEGEGDRLPFTDHFLYDVSKVIAAVEVKKTLFGVDLADSFLHLRELKHKPVAPDKRKVSLIEDSWRSVMRRGLPSKEELPTLSAEDAMIHHALVLEAHYPLRIVLGYSGYVSEYQLRNGMISFLSKQMSPQGKARSEPGFGINSFPNQIICGNASILKLDGMPFGVPLLSDGYWAFLASQPHKPLHTLLELLWTRLACIYNLPAMIFGEDLDWETVNPLLETKWSGDGWGYRSVKMSKTDLAKGVVTVKWEPETVSLAEFTVLNVLCRGEKVNSTDSDLIRWLTSQNTSFEKLAVSLNEKHLAYLRNGELILLTDGCSCAILPDGRYVAGENKTGRLLRWIDRFMDKRKDVAP